MRKTRLKAAAFILILLFSTLAGAMLTNLVWGNFGPMTPPELPTPIYIREDGSIEGGAGALQRTGNVYTFLRDINETVEIQKDNIILYGNGFKLKRPPEVEMQYFWSGGTGWYPSILISTRKNVTIQNIEFDACHTCIKVENSSKITIVQNKMHNAGTGVYMIYCTDSGIIGNEILYSSGTGLFILFSLYLNIAYNSISGTGGHHNGVWVSISDSTITRNDFTNNTNIGLYLYGDNKNNRIFENNFIDNDEGLCFMNTGSGSCFNNTLMNNYWSNQRVEIVNADEFNSVDPAPLASPISTSFDASLFPMPSLTPNPSTEPQQPEPFPITLIATASITTVALAGAGLLVYFKKHKREAEQS
jgi:parallel beta-helix repeat protein